jgi:hypothetical protein
VSRRRRALLLVIAFQVPVLVIIVVGSSTGHLALAIFVVVGLLVLSQVVGTVLSIRKAKARARLKGP